MDPAILRQQFPCFVVELHDKAMHGCWAAMMAATAQQTYTSQTVVYAYILSMPGEKIQNPSYSTNLQLESVS
jgi:hypothetical protein